MPASVRFAGTALRRTVFVQRLATVRHLRTLRAGDPVDDGFRELRARDTAEETGPRPDDSLRVRRVRGADAEAAVHGQLLPHRDALHPLRHRDRLSLSA